MAYLFRQKLSMADLTGLTQPVKKVLVFEPEEYLSALYGRYLREAAYEVDYCAELENLSRQIAFYAPELMVFNAEPDGSFQKGQAWLLSQKRNFPELLIISTAHNAGAEAVSSLLSAGVSSHINRKHSRPQDLSVVVKAVLNH